MESFNKLIKFFGWNQPCKLNKTYNFTNTKLIDTLELLENVLHLMSHEDKEIEEDKRIKLIFGPFTCTANKYKRETFLIRYGDKLIAQYCNSIDIMIIYSIWLYLTTGNKISVSYGYQQKSETASSIISEYLH